MVIQAHHGGESAGGSHGRVHQRGALLRQCQGLGHIQCAGAAVGGEFADTVSGDDPRARQAGPEGGPRGQDGAAHQRLSDAVFVTGIRIVAGVPGARIKTQ